VNERPARQRSFNTGDYWRNIAFTPTKSNLRGDAYLLIARTIWAVSGRMVGNPSLNGLRRCMYLDVKVRLSKKFWARHLVDSRQLFPNPIPESTAESVSFLKRKRAPAWLEGVMPSKPQHYVIESIWLVDVAGLEPAAACLQSKRKFNLSRCFGCAYPFEAPLRLLQSCSKTDSLTSSAFFQDVHYFRLMS
jgi:hypothetical protein